MTNFSCGLTSGALLVGECVIAPLNRLDFLTATGSNNIGFIELTRNEGWPNYGLPVEFLGEKFSLTLSFHDDELYSVWMAWHGGICSKKGWDTTERELITDKNSLARLIAKFAGQSPEGKEYNRDRFFSNGGYISTAASLKSVMLTVGFAWN